MKNILDKLEGKMHFILFGNKNMGENREEPIKINQEEAKVLLKQTFVWYTLNNPKNDKYLTTIYWRGYPYLLETDAPYSPPKSI